MKTLFTLLVLCSCAATAMAQGFGARCNTLASETRIQVLFDDRPAARDDSRSLDELRRLSQSATSPYHRVLRLGLSNLTVYLAREVQGSCRRAIVEAHEQEHVAVWRNHFRIGARLLTTQLQQALGQAAVFDDANQASALLTQRVENLVERQLKVLIDGIRSAHQQIDTPGSYQLEEGRMRACP